MDDPQYKPAGVLEIENGIFNLMVNLTFAHEAAGKDSQSARAAVAELFQRYATALLTIEEPLRKEE